jgi:hypothetical protein
VYLIILKYFGILEIEQEVPRNLAGGVLVPDNRLYFIDIQRQGITEYQKQQYRYEYGQGKRARVPADLDKTPYWIWREFFLSSFFFMLGVVILHQGNKNILQGRLDPVHAVTTGTLAVKKILYLRAGFCAS